MRILRPFTSLLLCFAASVSAFTPESGFYTVPGQPGTGIAVDINNQRAFLAGFIYDATGRPTFITAQGTLFLGFDDEWTLVSPLYESQGGRCIGADPVCPYRVPATTAVPNGEVRVRFVAENLAEVQWGTLTNIQVLLMKRGELMNSELESLLGEWDLIIDETSATTFFTGDKLSFAGFPAGPTVSSVSGCVVRREGSPACADGFRTAITFAPRQPAGRTYTMTVATNPGGAVVRRYRFPDHGLGGQFSSTIKGVVRRCSNVTTDPETCEGTDAKFVGYKSASLFYGVDDGTD